MSFFYKNLYPRDITLGSVDLKEKVYSDVVKDGVTNSVLKTIDPASDIDLPNFDDYSLEKRLKAGVDVAPVSLNVTDEVSEVDDEVRNTILSDSSVTNSSENESSDDEQPDDEQPDDETNV